MMLKILECIELCYLACCTDSDVKTGLIPVRLSIGCGLCGIGINIAIALSETRSLSVRQIFYIVGIQFLRLSQNILPGLVAVFVAWISHGAFGMGDACMAVVCGILSGWQESCLLLWRALIFGGIYGVWSLVQKKKERTDTFPFAPCMFTAYMLQICGY